MLQRKVLGYVQSASARIDVDFRDAQGRRYAKTAVVKSKSGDTEEIPLFTNHDDISGEVSLPLVTDKHGPRCAPPRHPAGAACLRARSAARAAPLHARRCCPHTPLP